MAGTRSTARNASASLSPAKSDDIAAGQKRKSESNETVKRSRKAPRKQATLEETLGDSKNSDSKMRDAEVLSRSRVPEDEELQEKQNGEDAKGNSNKIKKFMEEDEANGDARASGADGNGAVVESSQREKEMPSNILEKGVIYFFTRNRVGIENADSVGDLQRTFFVLRPLPTGAKLGNGALPDLKNNRLLALPKKAFPKSHNDRFMAFVEKANTSIQDLKDNFLSANEYETKTLGTRRTEPVTPIAEGVYAITRTEDATSHLVYSTTIPSELGEVQEDLGIKDQGSFIISVKNPDRSGPASAQLPEKPDFPKE